MAGLPFILRLNTFHHMYALPLLCLFTCWWIAGLLPHSGSCEERCYEYVCKYLLEALLSVLWGIDPEVESLDPKITMFR